MFNIPSLDTIKQYAVDILAIMLGILTAVIFIMYIVARSDLKEALNNYADEKASYTQAYEKVDELARQNYDNLKKIDEMETDHKSIVKALISKARADQHRIEKLTKINEEIKHASKEDDGPIAHVLFHTIDSLQQTTGTKDRNN